MKKYWLIIRNTWDEYLVYRLNFILWRVRVVIRFLITYFLWSTIYSGNRDILGYNRSTMLTYVVMVYLVSNFVSATRTQDIGSEINEGELTNYLLRPLSYFFNVGARDIGDKLINAAFTLVEMGLILLILRPPFVFQTNPVILVTVVGAFLCGIVIYFCISALLGFIGFWTTEVWSARFIFIILLDYLAGNLFPIDILPRPLATILSLTPFPYMYYFPAKIYLGQLPPLVIITGFIVLSIWIVVLIMTVRYVWQRGLRVYSAEGR